MAEDQNCNSEKDWWDQLSEPQKKHIEEGSDDVENGREISSEEFWQKRKKG